MRPSPALCLVPAQIKNQIQNIPEDGIPAPRITPVLIAAIVSVIAVTGIQIRIAILGIKLPSVLPVCLSGVEALFVTRFDCLSEQVRPVLIHVVVLAIAIVAIVRRAVVVIVKILQS